MGSAGSALGGVRDGSWWRWRLWMRSNAVRLVRAFPGDLAAPASSLSVGSNDTAPQPARRSSPFQSSRPCFNSTSWSVAIFPVSSSIRAILSARASALASLSSHVLVASLVRLLWPSASDLAQSPAFSKMGAAKEKGQHLWRRAVDVLEAEPFVGGARVCGVWQSMGRADRRRYDWTGTGRPSRGRDVAESESENRQRAQTASGTGGRE